MSESRNSYVIIGNGIAAAGCIEGIRSADREGKITVVSKERHPVYCRPLISYYLEGKSKLENIGYRPDDFYEKNGCEVLYGESAVKLEPGRVLLSDGSALECTAVCVATGSSPFLPPTQGYETVPEGRRFSFLTLDDALAIERAADGNSRVLIIGAGLIGLKCAEGLHGRVGSICVCDLAPGVLSSILDAETSEVFRRCLESNGIELMLADSVERFDGQTAVMRSGRTVEFDLLVTAVGVRANSALVADAGGEVGRGIVVDDHMRTSLDGVYAAGDCAEGYDVSLGARRVLALLPNAYMQGHAAGVNMAGGDECFDCAIPMNSIGLFGLHVMTAGSYPTEAEGGTVLREGEGENLRKFFVKDGRLVGYILVGDVSRAGVFTALIRERTPLDTLDFGLLPSFMAFSAENRRKKFGGVV